MNHDSILNKGLLKEREKELDALYAVAKLFSHPVNSSAELLQTTARIVCSALGFPKIAQVRITTDSMDILQHGDENGPLNKPGYPKKESKKAQINKNNLRDYNKEGLSKDFYQSTCEYGFKKLVSLEARYIVKQEHTIGEFLLEAREKNLIESITAMLADVLERGDLNIMLKKKKVELEQKNNTLREVLAHIEDDKKNTVKDIQKYINFYIHPHLQHLLGSSSLGEGERGYITHIEQSLNNLFVRHSWNLAIIAGKLTPREAEICGYIKNGMTSKEVAKLLHISESTIERHRNTIREKLELRGKNINLTSYLRSL